MSWVIKAGMADTMPTIDGDLTDRQVWDSLSVTIWQMNQIKAGMPSYSDKYDEVIEGFSDIIHRLQFLQDQVGKLQPFEEGS